MNGWSLSFMPGFGFALAATTLVGQRLGAGDPEGAEQRGYTAYRLAATLMGSIGLLFLIFPSQIVGFFTNDPEIIEIGTMPLRMVGLIQPLLAATMVFPGGLRGAGDTRFPLFATFCGILFGRLLPAWLFSYLQFSVYWIFAVMMSDYGIKALLVTYRYRSLHWLDSLAPDVDLSKTVDSDKKNT